MFRTIDEVKNRIDLNYSAAKELENLLEKNISNEEKLEIIYLLGIFYSEFVTGIYSSNFLEKKISEIGNEISFMADRKPMEDRVLMVMTRAANVGGHTVIAHNWINWDSTYKYSIVFTDMKKEEVPYFLKEAIMKSGGNLFFLEGSHMEKAQQLLNISQDYFRIVLLQHMYDIVPNLAYCNADWKIPIFMYNHANFKFSYGYAISDVLLNLCRYDVNKSIEYRGIDSSKSLLLHFPNAGNIMGSQKSEVDKKYNSNRILSKYGIESQKKLIVSMGDDFKFSDIIGCSFAQFVQKLINQRNGDTQYIIIGADPNKEKWKKLSQNTNGMARAVGYISREEASELIRLADLYIVSFPMAAAGVDTAAQSGVPYLMLAVTERSVEFFADNVTRSVNELTNRSNAILNGRVTRHSDCYDKTVMTQKGWCEKWHYIENSVKVHKYQTFQPKRNIQKEELINCQLMQERSNQAVKAMLQNGKLTPYIANNLFEICLKYDLHFIPEYFAITEWDMQIKNKSLASYTSKWLQIKLKGICIADYLSEIGIHEVSIYGMGQMGLNLYDELKHSAIRVECFIDRNANRLKAPISIIGIEEIPKQSHYIINTAFVSVEQLRSSYARLPRNYKIVSLLDVLDTLYGRLG